MSIDEQLQASNFLKHLIAELLAAQQMGIGLVVGAIAPQLDAQQAANALTARIKAAQAVGDCPKAAIDLANHVLAALEAETAFQQPDRH